MRSSPDIVGAPKVWSAGMMCIVIMGVAITAAVVLTNALELFADIGNGGEYWTVMDSSASLYFNHDFLDPPAPTTTAKRFHFGRVPGDESPTHYGSTPNSDDWFEYRSFAGEPVVAAGISYTPRLNSLRISLVPAIGFMAIWIFVGYLRNWTRWYLWKGHRFPVEIRPPANPSVGGPGPQPPPLPDSQRP